MPGLLAPLPALLRGWFVRYVPGELTGVLAEAKWNFPQSVSYSPERMIYLDCNNSGSNGAPPKMAGRIILSGWEALLDSVIEDVIYPLIDTLMDDTKPKAAVRS